MLHKPIKNNNNYQPEEFDSTEIYDIYFHGVRNVLMSVQLQLIGKDIKRGLKILSHTNSIKTQKRVPLTIQSLYNSLYKESYKIY